MSAAGKASAMQVATETATSDRVPAGQEKLPAVVSRPISTFAAASEPKHSRWKWALGGLLTLVLAALIYLQPWATQTVAVVVETVAPGPVTRVLAVNGRIAGVRLVDVQPLVSQRCCSCRARTLCTPDMSASFRSGWIPIPSGWR